MDAYNDYNDYNESLLWYRCYTNFVDSLQKSNCCEKDIEGINDIGLRINKFQLIRKTLLEPDIANAEIQAINSDLSN
ncbi:hypothetical protein Q9L58_010532, partial [Maublancomyces gigas]